MSTRRAGFGAAFGSKDGRGNRFDRRGASESILLTLGVGIALLAAVTVFGRRLVVRQAAATRALDRGTARDVGGLGLDANGPGEPGGAGIGDGVTGGSGIGGAGSGTVRSGTGGAGGIGLPPGASARGRSPFESDGAGGDGSEALPGLGGKGGAGGSGGAGGPGGGEAAAAGGGLPRRIEALLQERLQRTGKETTAAAPWVDRGWQEIERSPAYAALPEKRRAALKELWESLRRFETHGIVNWGKYEVPVTMANTGTLMAAIALARELEEGRLATDKGGRFLEALLGLVRQDPPGSPAHPYTSDAVLALGDDARRRNLYEWGEFPPKPAVEVRIQLALEVTRKVRGRLSSTNRGSGMYWVPLLGDPVSKRTRAEAEKLGARELEGAGSSVPDLRRRGNYVAHVIGGIAMEKGWGNCMECAAATAAELHDRGVSGVEIMHKLGKPGGGGEHVFVVIDRDPHSDPNDPRTWGDRAVVVDSWAGKEDVFRAGQAGREIFGAGEIQSHVRLPDPVGAPSQR